MTIWWPSTLRVGLLVGAVYGRLLTAQGARESIVVRVQNDSARALAGVAVIVVRGPDRASQQVITDSGGVASVEFADGTGDYLVSANAAGYAAVRRRITAAEGEHRFRITLLLKPDATRLVAIRVRAARDAPPPFHRSSFDQRPGDVPGVVGGVTGFVTPELAGSIDALALTVPGTVAGSTGLSVNGLSADQNAVRLNGGEFSSGTLPRAARVETRVQTSTFDATRGGFAGAAVDLHLGPGSRTYQRRSAFGTLSGTPFLASAKANSRPVGLSTLSVGADGELLRKQMTYNVAAQGAVNVGEPFSLFSDDDRALGGDVVRPQALATLRAIAMEGGTGPTRVRDIAVVSRAGTVVGRFDLTADSLAERTLLVFADWTDASGGAVGRFAAASTGSRRQARSAGAQVSTGSYIGARRTTLLQTRLLFSHRDENRIPLSSLPSTLVVLTADDATAAQGTSVQLGGTALPRSHLTRDLAEGSLDLTSNQRGTAHRLRAQLAARVQAVETEASIDGQRLLTYASVDALAANQPSSLELLGGAPRTAARVGSAALALSHEWTPSRYLKLISGVRLEAEQAFTPVITGSVGRDPLQVRRLDATREILPRVGFTYAYSRKGTMPPRAAVNGLGTFYQFPAGYLRGGVGRFRSLLVPDQLARAGRRDRVSGVTRSYCVGSAISPFVWGELGQDANNASTLRCLDSAGKLSDAGAVTSTMASSYRVPATWKASMGWGERFGAFSLRLDLEGAVTTGLADAVASNLRFVPLSVLGAEGQRPLYVSPLAIDVVTGLPDTRDARILPRLGPSTQLRSDLGVRSRTATVTLTPRTRSLGDGRLLYAQLAWTLQRSDMQFHDYEGAAAARGVPRRWAASPTDARQSAIVQAGLLLPHVATITVTGRFQSGAPFTPQVAGDVNGDGVGGDRAFIPTLTATGSGTARALNGLLPSLPKETRRCLLSQQGQVAAQSSCLGPGVALVDALIIPRVGLHVAGRTVRVALALKNIGAGLDGLFHGQGRARGWGDSRIPDPLLLSATGYDRSSGAYNYVVNARFGRALGGQDFAPGLFRVSLDMSIDLSTAYDVQQLRRAVEPLRGTAGWERRSRDSIYVAYLRTTASVYRFVLAYSDSLFLTAAQQQALERADSAYADSVRTIYRELAQDLYESGSRVRTSGLQREVRANALYLNVFWAQLPTLHALIDARQLQLLNELQEMFNTLPKDRKDSQFNVGFPVAPPSR